MSQPHILWQTQTPLLLGIERVIQDTPPEVIEQVAWHHEAVERSMDIDPVVLSKYGVDLINEIPYEEILDAITLAETGDSGALNTARLGRKLFLIARDSIILSTNQHLSDDYNTLREACHKLGVFADYRGANHYATTMAYRSVGALSRITYNEVPSVNSTDIVQSKVTKWLHTDELTGQEPPAVSSETYHQWRKEFRRVVNAYILLAAHGEDGDFDRFASSGNVLSAKYGEVNDAIDKSIKK